MTTPAHQLQTEDLSPIHDQPCDTAILLPYVPSASGLHTHPLEDSPIGPMTPVAGVPLFLRTVLTLQRAKITNIIVLCGENADALKALVQDARVRATIRWVPVDAFPFDDPRTWDALGREIRGLCLIVAARAVFSKPLIEELKRHADLDPGHIIVPIVSDLLQETGADVIGVPADRFGTDSWRSICSLPGSLLERIRLHAANEGRMRTVSLSPHSPSWSQIVGTFEEILRAERRLAAAPKASTDGFVDTYFNRQAAAGLTRLFLKAGWSPNAVTVLSLMIGFAAAGYFAQGTYWSGVVGALLFQLSAVVDCCDGDVARLTFRESRFGEQLDLIGDNVVHMAIFGALGWAGYLNGGGTLSLGLALLAMIGNACSLWFVTRAKAVTEKSGSSQPVQAARLDFIVKNVASRDFSLVVLIFSLFNLLGIFLWFAAIGSNLFWMTTAWLTRSPAVRA
jgi:phosphatidylglycerophosphate synthase